MKRTFVVDCETSVGLLREGIADLISESVCTEFRDFLTVEMKWHVSGNRLDWGVIDRGVRVYWPDATDEDINVFFGETTLSGYSHVAVIYADGGCGLVVPFSFARLNVDVLTYHSPGLAYFVGVRSLNELTLCFEDFIEVDGCIWVSGVRKP